MNVLNAAINSVARQPAAERPISAHTPAEVAAKFESLLLAQMFNAMQSTVEKSGLLDGGSAEETYREMLNQALADAVARRGGLGLAEQIAKQIEAYTAAREVDR
ncbi:MAG: rod-binding protein [Planctomycetes bacterium]|nr:rod-binding protein [Planctomycetota bacterium]